MTEGPIEVPLVWVNVDETPIVFANQFVGQFYEGEFTLAVGQVSPPVLVGSLAERETQAHALPFVPVVTLARFGLSKKRVEDLVRVLSQLLAREETERE